MSKIMIVDDEWAEREGMKYLIAKTGLGLEIEDAPNGAAALERLQQGAEIDILMTDIEMPFMDGLELCLRARELRPEMKTVIFSAHSQFEYAQKAIDAGVTSYILPPEPEQVINATLLSSEAWANFLMRRSFSSIVLENSAVLK